MKKVIETMWFCIGAAVCAASLADDFTQIGTNILPVVFEDAGLSQECRKLMADDITRIFSPFESLGDLFEIHDGDFQSDLLVKSTEAFPEKFFPYPVVVRTNGQLRLTLPTELSWAYTNAFAFAEEHAAAVSNAYDWIDWINSGEVTNASYQEKCDLAFATTMPELSTNAADNLAGSLFITHPLPPSILEFGTENLSSEETVVTTWARIPYRENGEADASAFPMIFHGGHWKYYLRR